MELNAPEFPQRTTPTQGQSRAAHGGSEGLDSTPSGPRTSSVALPPPGEVELPEREFRVDWAIDLYAETPEAAARKALRIHRNPESIATVFTVRDRNAPETEPEHVDLTELDEEAGSVSLAAGGDQQLESLAERARQSSGQVQAAWDHLHDEVRSGTLSLVAGLLQSNPRLTAVRVQDNGEGGARVEFQETVEEDGEWLDASELDWPDGADFENAVEELSMMAGHLVSGGDPIEIRRRSENPETNYQSLRSPLGEAPLLGSPAAEPTVEVGLVAAMKARCLKVYDDALPGSPDGQWEGYDWAVEELSQRIKEAGIEKPLALLESLKGPGSAAERYQAGEKLLNEIHQAMDDLAGAAIHDVLKPFKEDESLNFAGIRFVRNLWDNDDNTVVEIAKVQVGYAGTGEDPIEWVDWNEAPGFMEHDETRHNLAMLGLHFIDSHNPPYEILI